MSNPKKFVSVAGRRLVNECAERLQFDMDHLRRSRLAISAALLALMFAGFAVVQINDTNPVVYHRPSVLDAWSWVFFYGFIAALCAVSIFRRIPGVLLTVAAVFSLVEMARTAPGLYENLFVADTFTITATSMAAARPEVELTREFFGALIALLGVEYLRWQQKPADAP
jgi:hypothetical protein